MTPEQAINQVLGRNEEPHGFMRFAAGADFRHSCAECDHPRRHPIHGLEPGLEREPRNDYGTNNMPSVHSVQVTYAHLMDVLDEYNDMVEDGDQVHLAVPLQAIIAHYIAEQEAIASIKATKKKVGF